MLHSGVCYCLIDFNKQTIYKTEHNAFELLIVLKFTIYNLPFSIFNLSISILSITQSRIQTIHYLPLSPLSAPNHAQTAPVCYFVCFCFVVVCCASAFVWLFIADATAPQVFRISAMTLRAETTTATMKLLRNRWARAQMQCTIIHWSTSRCSLFHKKAARIYRLIQRISQSACSN